MGRSHRVGSSPCADWEAPACHPNYLLFSLYLVSSYMRSGPQLSFLLLLKHLPTLYDSHLSSFHIHPHTFFSLQLQSLYKLHHLVSRFRWAHVNMMGRPSPEVQEVWVQARTSVHPSGAVRWTYRAVWGTHSAVHSPLPFHLTSDS